jgi:hypothetical protein
LCLAQVMYIYNLIEFSPEYTVLEYTVLEYTVLEYTVLEYTVLE